MLGELVWEGGLLGLTRSPGSPLGKVARSGRKIWQIAVRRVWLQTAGSAYTWPMLAAMTAYEEMEAGLKVIGLELSDQIDGRMAERINALARGLTPRELFDELLSGSEFDPERLEAVLASKTDNVIETWKLGESLGQCFLEDARACFFPWPVYLDLRNPTASPAGADLVGFTEDEKGHRFAFGEVKTSTENATPPRVVTKEGDGLRAQLKTLCGVAETRSNLVKYLAPRAHGSAWAGAVQRCHSPIPCRTWRCRCLRCPRSNDSA